MRKIKRVFFALFIGYPLILISFLFKRNNKKWVVGSQDKFFCNSKYFFLKNIDNTDGIFIIWLTPSKSIKRMLYDMGMKNAFVFWEPKGIYHALTSGVYISSYTVNDDLPFYLSGNAKKVYLWHGIGIKNIYYKSNDKNTYNKMRSPIARFIYPPLRIKPDLFISTSPLMTSHFMDCFRIDKTHCKESLYPRCEILLWEKERIFNFLNKYKFSNEISMINKINRYKYVYIYMPTWRSYNKNSFNDCGFDLEKLNKTLIDKNEVMVLKLHPLTVVEQLKKYDNIIFLNSSFDIYPLLPYVDCLVTDYSSIYFDFLLMDNKNIVLFPYDYDEYININKDFAFEYDTYMPGERFFEFHALLKWIEMDFNLINNYKDKQMEIKKIFWGENKNDVTYSLILKEYVIKSKVV